MKLGSSETAPLLPVGCILAYAGVNPEALKDEGWLVCDGSKLPQAAYPELFAAIATNYGAPDPETFNIPDLRGLFLRGVLGNAPADRDPQSASRTAPADGGNSGNNVGSRQSYGTAPPKKAFVGESMVKVDKNKMDKGCADSPADYNDGSVTASGYSGGDLESRPVNKYVYFIIKGSRLTGDARVVTPPIGSVIPYVASDDAAMAANWILCDGRELSNRGVDFKRLFEAIGFSNGGDDGDKFLLPDYRGYFLRGVAGDSSNDPDVEARSAPAEGYPNNGNEKNAVGSRQGYATALPVSADFTTRIPHIPTNDGSKRVAGTVKTYFKFRSGSSSKKLTSSGGDAETRPNNMAVSWYVRFR